MKPSEPKIAKEEEKEKAQSPDFLKKLLFPQRKIPIYRVIPEKEELINFSLNFLLKKKNSYENLLFKNLLTSKDEFPTQADELKAEKAKYLNYLSMKLKNFYPNELLQDKLSKVRRKKIAKTALQNKIANQNKLEKKKKAEKEKGKQEEVKNPETSPVHEEPEIASSLNDFSQSSIVLSDLYDEDDGNEREYDNE